MLADARHGGEGHAVRKRIGPTAHIGFQRVTETVDTRVGGQPERHAQCQLIVHQGGYRHQTQAHAQHLFAGVCIGDDRNPRRFGPCARSGGNGNNRQAVIGLRGHFVIAHFATARRQHRERLGGIHGAAAAETHHAVMPSRSKYLERRIHAVCSWIGHALCEQAPRNSGGIQLALQLPAVATREYVRIGHQ